MTHGVKRLALMALLTAASLILFVVEAQIPSLIPVPGVKLGLANIITLVAMVLLSRREAGLVLLVRILLGAVFAGSPSTLLYSAAGGALAYAVMCLLVRRVPEERLWLISILAALAHNAGQLLVCILVTRTSQLIVYAPVLAASGILTGAFTGVAATFLVKALRKINL